MTLDDLVVQLTSAFGPTLRGVVLYGSAAAGEHIPSRSDYNVLVIVESLTIDALRRAGGATRAWSAAGNPPPLTLTSAEFTASADIFPMEYADILERHRVLYGDVSLAGIHIAPADLRLQVEQQAMGKLIQLRQGVLAAGEDVGAQTALLSASVSAVMVVFRAVARLHGRVPPVGHAALAEEIGRVAGFDPEPFVRVVRHVRGEQPLQGSNATLVLSGYLAGMERLVAHVNHYTPPPA